jgi:ABC-type antimicrobial peptide transport system permease subunit
MDEIIETQVENRDVQMTLLTIFAALALSLACIGIYGVLSYLVTQRVREIGVRMALGASTTQVVRIFIRHGLGLTSVGLAVGLCVSALAARAMSSMLYDVKPLDVRTYAMVAALLAATATLACYIPAVRAARVDPTIALRDE